MVGAFEKRTSKPVSGTIRVHYAYYGTDIDETSCGQVVILLWRAMQACLLHALGVHVSVSASPALKNEVLPALTQSPGLVVSARRGRRFLK